MRRHGHGVNISGLYKKEMESKKDDFVTFQIGHGKVFKKIDGTIYTYESYAYLELVYCPYPRLSRRSYEPRPQTTGT